LLFLSLAAIQKDNLLWFESFLADVGSCRIHLGFLNDSVELSVVTNKL